MNLFINSDELRIFSKLPSNSFVFKFIQLMNGIKSKTKLYNTLYTIFNLLYFVMKHFDCVVTNTEIYRKEMVYTVLTGYDKSILENSDIN